MKRIAVIFCAVAMAMLGASGMATANATGQENATAAADVVNCQYGSTYGTVVSAAYVKRYDGVNLGAIQLCKDSESKYWSFIIFYGPVPTGNWGYAYLLRYRDGIYVDAFGCNSPGGNKYVKPGQTRCWTPKIDAPSSSVTFLASGIQCEGFYDDCDFRLAEGYTARTR